MEEKKKNIPYLGCIDFYTGDARLPEGFPKVKVIKRGNKTKDNDPIEVKRAMRPGFHRCKPGESINWREENYSCYLYLYRNYHGKCRNKDKRTQLHPIRSARFYT